MRVFSITDHATLRAFERLGIPQNQRFKAAADVTAAWDSGAHLGTADDPKGRPAKLMLAIVCGRLTVVCLDPATRTIVSFLPVLCHLWPALGGEAKPAHVPYEEHTMNARRLIPGIVRSWFGKESSHG
jgi:hypothetical protein